MFAQSSAELLIPRRSTYAEMTEASENEHWDSLIACVHCDGLRSTILCDNDAQRERERVYAPNYKH